MLYPTYHRALCIIGVLLVSQTVLFSQVLFCPAGNVSADSTFHAIYIQWLKNNNGEIAHLRPRSVRYVDVVIHVVAREQFQPVSLAQALHQIDVLNRDFRAMAENTQKVPEPFRALIANSDIQFCLATTDPDGHPTSGITHTTTPFSDIAFRRGDFGERVLHYDQSGGKTGWDPERYINIWVAEFGSFLGYATMPGWPVEEEVGIIINIDHFGSVGDAGQPSRYGRGHTLTHEMGHFFGLLHIWGEGLDERCDDSDFIDDTPNVSGPNYHCHADPVISCGEVSMSHNFMDLVDDQCLAFFTPGQVALMNTVLDTFYSSLVKASSCPDRIDVDEDVIGELKVSYDPGSQKVTVFHPGILNGSIEVFIFAMDGKLVNVQDWSNSHTTLVDLSEVARGVYVVAFRIRDEWYPVRVAVY